MCGYPDVIGYAEDLFETVSALAISWRKSMKRSIGIVATLGTGVALGFISVNLAQRGLRSLGTQFGGAVVSQTTSTPVSYTHLTLPTICSV